MGFHRITAIIATALGQVKTPHHPTGPSASSGLLPLTGSNHKFGLTDYGRKASLRLSSSLQDFSSYSQLNPEEGDLDLGTDRGLTRTKPVRALQRETASLSFSKERALPATPFLRKKCVRTTIGLLCLLLLVLLVYLSSRHFSAYWSQEASQFSVILDSGSTGTRVYVYEWLLNHKNGHPNLPIVLRSLPLQKKLNPQNGRAYSRMETEPGFDKLVRNVSGLKASIRPLLQWAEKQIPNYAHKNTPLFLYATAGLRRLPSSDSDWLLDKAWSILKNSSFLCRREWVKIISGMEEAYFGWIALNHHMDTLGYAPGKSTFGSLDLGGSSLQVTFETNGMLHDVTNLNLSIGAVKHHLSAYSLSGYGLNDAFDKSVVFLLKKLLETTKPEINGGIITLYHPCLQNGYKEQYTCSQCSSLKQEGRPLVGEKNMKKGGSGTVVELLGAPNWEECSALAKSSVNLSEWSHLDPGIDCKLQPCALSNHLTRPHGKFYAMSGFFVVFRFFNLTYHKATLNDVLEKGREFCGKTWEVAKHSVAPQPFIEQYCFRAPYIVSLLRDGLHIKDNQVVIGSGSITWTLGVALLEAGGALPRSEFRGYSILHMKQNSTAVFIFLFVSLILLIFVLFFIGNWTPRFFRKPYLPLFRQPSGNGPSVLNISSPFRWSPINSGDIREKMPLSPTVGGSRQGPFGTGHGLGGSHNIQLIESSPFPPSGGVSHSISSGSLRQIQFDNGNGSFWAPHRGQMRLQSRRSQSREDLNSSLAEAHLVKV